MAGNQIQFGIGFNVNEAGLNKLKQSLMEIQKLTQQDLLKTGNFNVNNVGKQLREIQESAAKVQTALTSAFNPQLGTTNIVAFQKQLQSLDIGRIAAQFSSLGAVGQTAFLDLTRHALSLNVPLKQNVSWLTKMGQTLTNQIKWHVASSAINGFTNSIQSAFNYVKALDSSLTDIRIVTGESREEMAKFAMEANNAAQALGRQTKEYTNAALSFYQQGLSDDEVRVRTEATLKAQNITGAGTEIADQLTAVWNGFQINIENTEMAVDKLAAVADSSASNMSELATGMSKVASVANNMGVDIDQLTAQLATIIATTRQAPETVGNALKTIYTRINDIKTGSDEAEISLGNYTKKMADVGINVLDTNGRLRDTGEVMEEIGARWSTMTHEQQIYLAQTMAGQRQMNNLISLFDNWEKYSEMLNVSLNSQGALNEKNSRYMESLSAHINQFKAAVEGMQSSLIDTESIKDLYDTGTKLVELVTTFINSIGGMQGALIGLGAIGTRVFANQITEAINVALVKLSQFKNAGLEASARAKLRSDLELQGTNINSEAFKAAENQLLRMHDAALQYQQAMSNADKTALNSFMEQQVAIDGVVLRYDELIEKAVKLGNTLINQPSFTSQAVIGKDLFNSSEIFKPSFDKNGQVDFDLQEDEVRRLTNAMDLLHSKFQVYKKDLDNVKSIPNGWKDLNKQIELQKSKVDELKNKYDELRAKKKRSSEARSEWEIENAKLGELQQKLQEIIGPLEAFKDRIRNAANDETTFGENTQHVKDLLDQLTPETEEVDVVLEQLSLYLEQGSNNAKVMAGELRKMIPALKDIRGHSMQTTNAFAQFLKGLETKSIAQSFTTLLQGVSSLAMGIQSLVTAHKTYQQILDGSIDKSEGYLQILMSMSMALPMLISGVTALGKGIFGLGLGLTKVLPGMAGVAAAATGATASLGAMAAVAGVAAAAIAGLVLIGFGLVKLYQALTADVQEYKKSQKALEESQKKYEELKNTYNDLKSTIENYNSASEAISKLTVGTQEWRDAISSANDYAKNLLEIWPKLKDSMYIDENGQIHFKEGAVEKAQEESQVETAKQGIATTAQNLETQRSAIRSAASGFFQNTDKNIDLLEKVYSEDFQAGLEALHKAGTTLDQEIDYLYDNGFFGTKANAIVQALKLQGTETANIINSLSDKEVNQLIRIEDKALLVFQEMDKMVELENSATSDIATDVNDFVTTRAKDYAGLIAVLMATSVDINNLTEEEQKALFDNYNQFEQQAQEIAEQLNGNKNLINNLQGLLSGNNTFVTNITKAEKDLLQSVIDSLEDEELSDRFNIASKDWLNQQQQILQEILDTLGPEIMRMIIKSFEHLGDENISPELLKTFQTLYNNIYQKLGKETLEGFNEAFLELEPDKAKEFLDTLSSLNNITSVDDLRVALANAHIRLADFNLTLEDLIKLLGINAKQSFDDLAAKYKKVADVVDDLHLGDAISAEDAALLDEFGLNLKDYFQVGIDGEYVLVQKAEELKNIAESIQTQKLGAALYNAQQQQQTYSDIINQLNQEDIATGRKIDYLSDDGGGIYYENDNNYTRQQVQLIRTLAENNLAQGLPSFSSNKLAMWESPEYTFSPSDIENINTILKEAVDNIDQVQLALDQTTADVDKFTEALTQSIRTLDENVDKEEWEDLAKIFKDLGSDIAGVSENVRHNEEVSQDLAEEILRYNAAIENATDKFEEWAEALNSTSLSKHIKAAKELRNVYGDLLDLDSDSFSEGFVESADNLELLNKAMNGTEEEANEAYEQLQALAKEDFKAQILMEVSGDDQAIADITSAYDQIDAWLATNPLDMPVGARIEGADSVIEALNGIISACNMTQEQADAMIGSLGMNAEYEPNVQEEEVTYPGGYNATLGGTVEAPYNIPMGFGGFWAGDKSGTTVVPGVIYEKQPDIVEKQKVVVPTVKVKSLTKAAGGDFKRANSSGGSGGKKSGGGGGGGGKQPKKTEKFKSKIDPYHDVNIKIGDVKEGLDKLGKQRDKLIGKDAIDNLAKQINLMEREKELLQEKAKIAQEELQKQADELAKYGAIIDSEGNILNYKQLLLDKQNQINEAIDIANGLDADSQEAYLKYVEDLKKEYKELEEGIKNLDDTKQLLDDLGLDYQDIINQQIELAMEAFNLEIEVHLDMKDAKKEFNEFRKKVMDQVKDDQYGGLAAAAARNYGLYYNNEGTGIIRELQQHALDIQREAEIVRNGGFSQIYGDNLAAAAEDLKKYNDELMKGLEEVQELVDEVHDDFLSAIDAMDEAFDTQQENLDKIDDLLQHDMEILQLIHGEENYDEMTLLWQQQVDQDTKRLAALQQEQQYWKNRVAQYQEGTEEWKKAMENWEDAFEKTNEAMLNSVKNLQSQWENSINKIMSGLRNATYGGNMNAALEDWDKMTWHSDRYLDSLERATGLLNLQNKYQDMINKTTDPRIQAKLAELEEQQLDALSQKEHLREIDLKISEQQLAVLQAQMALEDAQQAKTKLRLRRDSQGNYTYQYVADEDDIAEKTQEYANALAEYRLMVKDSLHDDLQDLSDYTQEFYEKMQEAQMMYGDDTERLMEEQARLYELYMGDDGYITRLAADANYSMRDLQEATYIQAKGLNELLRDDLFNKFLGPDAEMRNAINELLGAGGAVPSILDAFVNDSAFVAFDNISEKCKETLSGPEGLLPEWQSALWTIAAQYETDFVPRVIEAMNQLQYANQAYIDGLAIMQQAANRTTQQIALGLYADTAYTNALNDATNALLQTQDAELQKAEQVYESLKKNEEAFKDQAQAAIDAANAIFLYWLALNGMTASTVPYTMNGISGVNVSSPSVSSNSPSYSGSDGGSGSGGGSGGDAGGNQPSSSSSKNQNYGAANAGVYRGVSNTSSIQGTSKGMGGTVTTGNADSSAYWSTYKDRVKKFGSGGYTGTWGDDPRWALLDQQELVLDADDTKNVLNAVNIVRTIADKVASATNAAAANIGTQGLGSLLAAAGEQILQNVVINADFPAVQDAAQIKQAFNELVNLASQRASTNRRSN